MAITINIANSTYDAISKNVSAQESNIRSIRIGNSGTKLYVAGRSSTDTHQYTLSSAYDLSTATYDSVAMSAPSGIEGISFKSDGTKIYESTSSDGAKFREINLTTPWSVASTTFISWSPALSVVGDSIINQDGTAIYDISTTTIRRLSFGTAYDATTITTDQSYVYTGDVINSARGLYVSNDEQHIFLACINSSGTAYVEQFYLSVAGDLSTISHIGRFAVGAEGMQAIHFSDDLTTFFVATSTTIYQYSTNAVSGLIGDILNLSPTQYWPMNEVSGVVVYNWSSGSPSTTGGGTHVGSITVNNRQLVNDSFLYPDYPATDTLTYTNLPTSYTSLQSYTNWTVLGFLKLDVIGSQRTIFQSAQNFFGQKSDLTVLVNSSGFIEVYRVVSSVETLILTSSSAIETGALYMFAVVDNGTDTKLYINASLSDTGLLGDGWNPSFSYLGKNSGDTVDVFNGTIGHVAIFDAVLSPAQLSTLYDSAVGTPTTDPSGDYFWPFDGDLTATNFVTEAGSTFIDSGGYALFCAPGDGIAGDAGQNLILSYGTITADIAPVSNFTGDLTVSFWLNISYPWSTSGTYELIRISGNPTSSSETENALLVLSQNASTGQLTYSHEYGAGSSESSVMSGTISEGVNYHVALVRDDAAKTVKLYIDGSLADTFTYTNSCTNTDTATQVYINTISGGASSSLIIDNLKIWGSALSSTEVGTDAEVTTFTGTGSCDQTAPTASGTATKTGSSAYDGTSNPVGQTGIQQTASSTSGYGTIVDPPKYGQMFQKEQSVSGVGTVVNSAGLSYYFADSGFTTSPSSTPANTMVAPRLVNAGSYSINYDISSTEVIKPSFGSVTLDNTDGGLDHMIDKNFSGGTYKLYYGPEDGVFPDDFTLVLTTTLGEATFDYNTLKVQLKDNSEILKQPFINKTFSGTGGTEGEDSVKGKPKPRVIGTVWGCPAILIDSEKLLYYVCQEGVNDNWNIDTTPFVPKRVTPHTYGKIVSPTGAIPRTYDTELTVYDGGSKITNEEAYPDRSTLLNISPSPGRCKWYIPKGGPTLFRLGSVPAFDIRCDISTAPIQGGLWHTEYLLDEVGVGQDVGGILDGGVYIADTGRTYSDVLEHSFLRPNFYAAWFGTTGNISFERSLPPVDDIASPSIQFSFKEYMIQKGSISVNKINPVWKHTLKHGECWPSQLATGINEYIKREFSDEGYHTTSVYENTEVKSYNPLAREIISEIWPWRYPWDVEDLQEYFIAETLTKTRYYVRFVISRGVIRDNTTILELNINDNVALELPRFGFENGRAFRVHGIKHDYINGKITFTLWG